MRVCVCVCVCLLVVDDVGGYVDFKPVLMYFSVGHTAVYFNCCL